MSLSDEEPYFTKEIDIEHAACPLSCTAFAASQPTTRTRNS